MTGRATVVGWCVMAALAAPAEAQTVSKKLTATQIANKVDTHYAKVKTLRARFAQRYTNTAFGKATRSTGKVYVARPGNVRFDYLERKRAVRSFIADGTNAWMVDHDTKQYANQPMSATAVPAAVSFLTGSGHLVKDFHVSLASGKGYGNKGDYVLELTPKKPSAAYTTLWLAVDPNDFHVRESVVLEASSNINRFIFGPADTKKAIKSSVFTVSARKLKKRGYTRVTKTP